MAGKYALIIGNSEYQDPNLTRLKAPEADVEGLSALLRDPLIGAFDEVVTLANEFSATIRRTIGLFFAEKTTEDLLVLYFSGHGVLDDNGELFLATKDTERDLISATAIPAAFITGQMDRSRSKRQVLILDCCHSGAFARGSKGIVGASVGTATAFQGTGYGRVVLTATDATQFAWEGDQVIGSAENSLFTHFMIEGIQTGQADTDGDGRISIENLYDYVYDQVVKATPKQTPGKWSYKQQGEIVIAKNPNPVTKPAELPRELREAIDSPAASVRAGAVSELEQLLKGTDPGLALAALDALKRLDNDDSHRVANAATQVLNAYNAAVPALDRARAEQELLAWEKAEQERVAKEQAEAERLAREKAEQERIAREKEEQARLAREKAEQERAAKAQAEAERIARERAEEARIATVGADPERLARLQAQQARIAKEQAERQARLQAEQERLAREKKIRAEKAAGAQLAAQRKALRTGDSIARIPVFVRAAIGILFACGLLAVAAGLNVMWTRLTGPAPTKAAGAPVPAATRSSIPTATPFSTRAGSSFGPSPTPFAISRVLAGTLPRQLRYSGLLYTFNQAEITNRDPGSNDLAPQYRSDQAYAILDVTAKNTETSTYVRLIDAKVRLRLADGKLYESTAGWLKGYEAQSTQQTKLVFAVPMTATWQGAQFLLNDRDKEPALLPLDGVVPTSPYPITVKDPGQATVDQIIYKVTSATLDLDWRGERAGVGKRFMGFSLHLTSTFTSSGGANIWGSTFRLFVDGEPLAPSDAPNQVIRAVSTLDVQVAFLVPAKFDKLELQVGEVSRATVINTAKIPIALKAP